MPGLIVAMQEDPGRFERNREIVRRMSEIIMHEPFYKRHFYEYPDLGLHACRVYLDHEHAPNLTVPEEPESVRCVFSGELYGLDELRAELPHNDKVSSKNLSIEELIAQLYLLKGKSFLRLLNGWFNLLIVDSRDNSVLVANDRLGLQRMYSCQLSHNGILFAPELKCFKEFPDLDLSLDWKSVAQSFKYNCILNNNSFYREVKRCPIASSFTFRDGKWHIDEYWKPEEQLRQSRMSINRFMDKTADVFESIIPDYYAPGQTCLSLTGGLDTRSILSVLSRNGVNLPCYTFGGMFRDSFDVKLACRLAKHFQNRWDKVELGLGFLDSFEHWADKAIFISDGIARLTTCHEYYLNLQARRFGTIRLTGKYGSQIVRGVSMLKDRSPDLRIFSPNFLDRYMMSDQKPLETGIAALLREELPQLEGIRHTLEAAALTVCTPYTDNRFVDTILSAPHIEDDSLLQKYIIMRNAPGTSRIPTNRGELMRDRSILTELFYKSFNFVDSVYNWEKLPSWALPMCRLCDISGVSRLFIGRNEWIHYRKWFTKALRSYIDGRVLDPGTLSRDYYDGNFIERMMRSHYAGSGNFTSEIDKIASFETWRRQNGL